MGPLALPVKPPIPGLSAIQKGNIASSSEHARGFERLLAELQFGFGLAMQPRYARSECCGADGRLPRSPWPGDWRYVSTGEAQGTR
jgi:hypothetical protein